VAEIMTATGSQNRHAMDSLLFRMLETGEVTRPRRGIYSFQREADHTDHTNASVMRVIERNQGQDIENKAIINHTDPNHTDHTDHTGISAADRLSVANPPISTLPKVNGRPASDPWEGLDIPASLRREPLGPPAISAGPDDDLGDLE
jgi:hypothetical protein